MSMLQSILREIKKTAQAYCQSENESEFEEIMLRMTIEFDGCVDCPFNKLDFNLIRRCGQNNEKIDIEEMFNKYEWPSVCPMREMKDENSNP